MRIVIVEDEALIREGLSKTVGKINPEYEVVGTAADGEAGYDLIRRSVPDLVIMDIRMPKMDGLDMMEKLRGEQVKCKVIVLSAYSDFNYAQQAIRLGIVGYLLKPINLTELKNALEQVEETCRNEAQTERIFSWDSIFWGIINGKLGTGTEFDDIVWEKYGFTVNDAASMFILWLGKEYESRKRQACQLLEDVSAHTMQFESYVMELDDKNVILMIIYHRQAPASDGSLREQYRTASVSDGSPREQCRKASASDGSPWEYFHRSVVPMLADRLGGSILGIWKDMEKMLDIRETISELEKDLQWGLVFDERTMICRMKIESINVLPLRYPLGIEDDAGLAVRCKDVNKLIECYKRLYIYCMDSPHEPDELKKCLIRFNWAVIQAGGQMFSESIPEFQHILHNISVAVTWAEIKESMEILFSVVKRGLADADEQAADGEVSEMVRKAQKLIEKYYDQGVTLEEIAGKLFVSGEYLSAQFRKETGVTFTGTVRRYRIAKVKKLLLETQLKLSQIADLAGYSDPKYMSRVFKEETGMLPSEYRKSVH